MKIQINSAIAKHSKGDDSKFNWMFFNIYYQVELPLPHVHMPSAELCQHVDCMTKCVILFVVAQMK